ncbi:MAG TPA: hypothetical protein VMV43_10470 [Candidatus Nanopelagicaceae bacterium]|nr:hypothetical protein [Candidatus Nanopelagicaceae bacterium]
MSENSEKVLRSYHCRVCDTTHKVSLQKKIIENQSKFPFSYFFLHGELKNILTTLYLDRHLEIRGVDVQKLTDDDIFSKDQVVSITSTLVKEIEELRNENEELRLKLKKERMKVK